MITFTKTLTITNSDGNVTTLEQSYRRMDERMFEHYKQNPLGMDDTVREHFKIPDNRYYTVSMWPEDEFCGVVRIISNSVRVVKAAKISKSNQPST